MKMISLWQPWAWLIEVGVKRIETRSWKTPYRGPLAIHATARIPRDVDKLVHSSEGDALRAELVKRGKKLRDLPCGVITCVVLLQGIDRIYETTEIPPDQLPFGDFRELRYGWRLHPHVKVLAAPVPCVGVRGIQRVPKEVEDKIAAQIPGEWL